MKSYPDLFCYMVTFCSRTLTVSIQKQTVSLPGPVWITCNTAIVKTASTHFLMIKISDMWLSVIFHLSREQLGP